LPPRLNSTEPTTLQEWKRGWVLVLTAAMGMSLATIYLASAGVVMKPLNEAFGWTRGQVSSIAAIKSAVIVLASPILGWAVDRFGPRRIALPGIVLYTAALAAAGLTGPSIWSWYLVWTLAAFAGVMVGSTIWTAAVASRFVTSRGLALGVTMAGLGMTSTLVPPLAVWALETFGWRGMYFTLGAFGLVTAFPMAFLFFYEAGRSRGKGGAKTSPLRAASGVEFGAAIRQWRYWRLALAFLVGSAAMGVFQLHLFPMMTDAGLSPMAAAGYIALMGPLTIVGRIGGGFLMDRIHAPYVAAATFALPILNCFLIPHLADAPGITLVVILIAGIAMGAESDTIAVLVSRYFGLRSYGRVYAILAAIFALGFGVSGTLGGFLFDHFGNYDLFLKAVAACLCVAVVLVLSLGRYPTLQEPPAPAPGPLASPAPEGTA
jgi:predicted MFS family arabinose efflux permease